MDNPTANTRIQNIEWETLVAEAEGGEPNIEHEAYTFSTKTFTETDDAGVYDDG